jgi:hypothetical protein
MIYAATLEELQSFTLLAMFVRGTVCGVSCCSILVCNFFKVNHSAGWIFVSLGLRKAQDVGAHRKKLYHSKPSVNDELWKRAFWCLVAYDRMGSAILGRPCALGEEE